VIKIPFGGTITAAYIYSYASTAGTNEAWDMYIEINDATDYLIASLEANTNVRVWSNAALNIAVAQGDSVLIKFTTPTWTTKPATWRPNFTIYIK
jgi:hypothetical protein